MIPWRVRILVFLFVSASCFGCDRFLKIAAMEGLQGMPPRSHLGGVVVLQYEENQGAMLSIGARLPAQVRFWLFIVGISVILGGFALFVLFRSRSVTEISAGALAFGGGLGNLVDRLTRNGAVVDFVSLGIGPVRTAVFNWADAAILGGVVIYMIALYRRTTRSQSAPGP